MLLRTCYNFLVPSYTRFQGYKTFFMLNSDETKIILLINVKMPTNVDILTFMSRINYWFLSFEPEFSTNFDYLSIYELLKFHAQMS